MGSAPIGPFHLASSTRRFTWSGIWLKINGQVKQSTNLSRMIRRAAMQISRLSQANALFPGDIIDSGTPENVGPVVRGNVVNSHIDRAA